MVPLRLYLGLFNFGPSRGRSYIEQGCLFRKSSDKNIFGSFSVPLSHGINTQFHGSNASIRFDSFYSKKTLAY